LTQDWKDSLKGESLDSFLAWLGEHRQVATEEAVKAPTWELVLEARGRVKQMEDLIADVTAEEREAQAYADYQQRAGTQGPVRRG
jgi:hypothetical protein